MTDEHRHEVLTLLEDAVAARRPLVIELRDGRHFCDGVCDVRRVYGEDFVVFHAHNRMMVRDIMRAAPTSSHEREDVECVEVEVELDKVADGSGAWAAL
jgi:hypothetical protein